MRVVIDTNVLIAAYAARGLCESIVELCIANDDIFLTREMLADVLEKLTRKLKLPAPQARQITDFLANNSRVIKAARVPARTCRDPDDENVLGAAKAEADFIITGDQDLLVLKEYGGARILTPRAYWETFRSRKELG